MATHVPSDTAAFAAAVDAALRRVYERNLGVDLLDETGHRPNGGPQDDPTLTRDRALLRTSSGDAGFRPISDRLQALNSLCLVLPQLIDKTDRAGKITPGFFNDLTSILGAGSFDEGKEETRWEAFLNSGSAIAGEFRSAHARHKAIHDELRARIDVPPAQLHSKASSTTHWQLRSGTLKSPEVGDGRATRIPSSHYPPAYV